MANWNLPTIQSDYIGFVNEMNSKFVDAVTLLHGAPVNLPEHSIRWNRSINVFEEWDLTTWIPQVLNVEGGGTGATTSSGARTVLGIGSMGTQNSNAVNITGGSITGVALDAGAIATGIVPLARGGTGASLSLAAAGWILISNGSAVGFNNGSGISQLNASSLATGIVPLARLSGVGLLASNNTWAAGNTFAGQVVFSGYTDSHTITIRNPYPTLNLDANQAPPDSRIMRLFNPNNGDIWIQRVNDAYSQADNLLIIRRTGWIEMFGGGVTNINANHITDGLVNPARLGNGAAHAGVFLRGDSQWAVPSLTPVDPIPSGMIGMFATNCPAGWTRVAALDNRMPLGSTYFGGQGGSTQHSHGFGGGQTGNAGAHSHPFSGSGSGGGVSGESNQWQGPDQAAGGSLFAPRAHTHNFNVNVNVSGETGGVGDHSHSFGGGQTGNAGDYPPYTTVVFCQKN